MSRTSLFLAAAAALLVFAFIGSKNAEPTYVPQPAPAPMPAAVLVNGPAAQLLPAAQTPDSWKTSRIEMTVQADRELISNAGGDLTAQIDIKNPSLAEMPSLPVSMVLVFDRSGSMQGSKLTDAKNAARAFVNRLEPRDTLGLVHFGSDVTPFEPVAMNAEGKAKMLKVIDSIEAEGGTNISGALDAAFRVLVSSEQAQARAQFGEHSLRLVLVSDGQPTEGRTSIDDLVYTAQGIHSSTANVAVTALGIGSDYNGVLMQRIAEAGGGFYGYLRDAGQLSEILAHEVAQARATNERFLRVSLQLGDGISITDVPGRIHLGNQIPLPDMKPGDEARIFVQLHANPATGDLRSLMNVSVTGIEASTATNPMGAARADRGLQIRITNDTVAVEKSKNDVVFANAVTAQAGVKMNEVAAAMDRGDRSTALSLLANVKALFSTSATASALSGATVASTDNEIRTSRDLKASSLGVHRANLKSFGEKNSYGDN